MEPAKRHDALFDGRRRPRGKRLRGRSHGGGDVALSGEADRTDDAAVIRALDVDRARRTGATRSGRGEPRAADEVLAFVNDRREGREQDEIVPTISDECKSG